MVKSSFLSHQNIFTPQPTQGQRFSRLATNVLRPCLHLYRYQFFRRTIPWTINEPSLREATVPCFYSLRFELTGVIYKRAKGVVTSPTNVKAINVLCTVIEYSLFFNVPSYWQLLCIVLATSVEFRIHFRGGFTCSYSDSAFVETTDSVECFCKSFMAVFRFVKWW